MRYTTGLFAMAWLAGCGRGGELPGTSPDVEVLTPVVGQAYAKQSEVVVRIRVADAEDQDLSRITLSWGGIAAGVAAPAHPNSEGIAELHMQIQEPGDYIATVSAQDGDLRVTDAEISVRVVDGDQDEDGEISSVLGGSDCDDGSASVHPGAAEVCNGIDDDCSGTTDVEAVDAVTFYRDQDEDGDGVLLGTVEACEAPPGYAATATDCDDNRADVYAGANELCDGVDNDCEGDTDEPDAIDGYAWYADADSDGFGDPAALAFDCEQPEGFVDDNTDCDDTSEGTYLGAPELCDDADNDCDGGIDEAAVDRTNWYADVDEDGAGAGAATLACDAPVGFVALSGDCDDSESEVGPLADEFCNDRDDNCNGSVDEDTVDTKVWYTDADGDGYGDAAAPVDVCLSGPGLVSNADDCNDGDADQNPETVWYADTDGDGFGDDDTGTVQCEAPGAGWIWQGGDCADYDALVNPDAAEVCMIGNSAQGQDDDCDGVADEVCPEIHCGLIAEDEVWSGNSNGHLITCPVVVEGQDAPVLTIEDGAQVWISPLGAGRLDVGMTAPGSLEIQGTTLGVDFSAYEGPENIYLGGITLGALAEPSVIEGLVSTDSYHPLLSYADVSVSNSEFVARGDVAVQVEGATADFDGVDISGSSGDGLIAYDTVLWLRNSHIHDNGGIGLFVTPTVEPAYGAEIFEWEQDAFTNNRISGNGIAAHLRPINLVKALAADNQVYDNDQNRIYVRWGKMDEDATWHDVGAAYEITTIHVRNEAVWTLDDGVELQANNGQTINLGCPPSDWGWTGCDASEHGDLVVNGDVKGVKFTSSMATPVLGDVGGMGGHHVTSATHIKGLTVEYSRWNRWYSDEGIDFEDVTIVHSGEGLLLDRRSPGSEPAYTIDGCRMEDLDNWGLIVISSQPTIRNCVVTDVRAKGIESPMGALTLTDTEVSNTAGGYAVYHWGDVVDISGNTITGNTGLPLMLREPMDLQNVGSNNQFTGNEEDYVTAWNNIVDKSVTFPVLDVPIYLKNGMSINPGREANPTVTILDNHILMGPGTLITVGNEAPGGRLDIFNTQVDGMDPTPGYWAGIGFFQPQTGSILESEIRNAGGGWAAAITLLNSGNAIVADSVIANSASWGIRCNNGCASIAATLATNQYLNNVGGDWNP